MKRHFFVLAAVIISSTLNAQSQLRNGGDTTSTSLDEVVLTANKYPNKTSLTGKVVTIITSEQLERSGGKDLSQLLTEQAGLFISAGYGSRGLTTSPLCSELLAALINAEPLPLERSLYYKLHPARFLLKKLQQNRD